MSIFKFLILFLNECVTSIIRPNSLVACEKGSRLSFETTIFNNDRNFWVDNRIEYNAVFVWWIIRLVMGIIVCSGDIYISDKVSGE